MFEDLTTKENCIEMSLDHRNISKEERKNNIIKILSGKETCHGKTYLNEILKDDTNFIEEMNAIAFYAEHGYLKK